jgi:hypothetical protein
VMLKQLPVISVPDTSGMMCWRISRKFLRELEWQLAHRNDDPACLCSLRVASLPCDENQNQHREENQPAMVLK